MNSTGIYRIRTQAIDRELNLSDSPSTVVKVGGATGEPPLVSATLDKLSGPAPLTVNIDMSASSDADGTISWYYYLCNGSGYGTSSKQGSCTYTTPGAYWMTLQVQDNTGFELMHDKEIAGVLGISPQTVHTLNGTAVTSSRTVIAVLEQHQQADGTVQVPQPLLHFGAPAVIENAPVDERGHPFPTREWLTCRALATAVSRLEADGGVRMLEQDESMAPALAGAHARHQAVHDGHRVAGAGDPDHVKCLHAHYAWFLAGGDDPVGAWVHAHLDEVPE